jgi:hypothetical protein
MDIKYVQSRDDIRRNEDCNPEVDDKLVCIDVYQETHDVKTFTFVSPGAKQFAS